jgi:hypothetical protein
MTVSEHLEMTFPNNAPILFQRALVLFYLNGEKELATFVGFSLADAKFPL